MLYTYDLDYQELQENEDAFMQWVFEMEQAYEESKYDEMFSKEDNDESNTTTPFTTMVG